jgi:hypothetical protein
MNTIKPLGLAKLFSLAPQPFIIKIVAWLISMREITTRLSLTLATRLGWRGKMQPGRRERTGGRGSVYVRKGDYDKAQSDFNKAIHRRGPDFDSTAIEVATKLTQKYAFLVALCHGAWTACIRIAYAGNANLWLWTVSVCNFAQAPVSGDSRLT